MSLPSFDSFIPGNREDHAESAGCRAPGYLFAYRGSDLLVSAKGDAIELPFVDDSSALGLAGSAHILGTLDGVSCRAVSVPRDASAPEGWSFMPVRTLIGPVSDSLFGVVARGLEITEWDRTNRHCGVCGAATRPKDGERAMECPACGSLSYPRISPAVIVAVVRGDRILLARAHRFPPGFYSVLAGFVEPGENLEQCVAREVREETAIEVRSLRYLASQPWPFPNSLMVAFTAEYAAGEITVDPSEVVDAGWYTADALPTIPERITVARRLIDWFVESRGGGR